MPEVGCFCLIHNTVEIWKYRSDKNFIERFVVYINVDGLIKIRQPCVILLLQEALPRLTGCTARKDKRKQYDVYLLHVQNAWHEREGARAARVT